MQEYLKKYKLYFAFAAAFSFFINVLMLTSPIYMMQVFDRVISSRSVPTLFMLTLVAVGALVVWAALEAIRSRLLAFVGVALDKHLGDVVVAEQLRMAAAPQGGGYAQGLRDVGLLRSFLTGNGVIAFFDAPWAPVLLLVIYLFHPLLGIIATLGIALLFGLAIVEERINKTAMLDANTKLRAANHYIDQALRNGEVISSMGMQPALVQRWKQAQQLVLEGQTRISNRAGTIVAASKFMRMALQIVMMAAGAYLVINENATPGIMMAATLILGRAMAPVEIAIAGWKQVVEVRAAYQRLKSLLAARHAAHLARLELPTPTGNISLERVVYGPTPAQIILRGVSFQLRAGESLGLIGPSAAGKSTLLRVILGVWKPLGGVVRLDGANIEDWDPVRLGRYIGYLPQDVELFTGTVAENIARLGDAAACSEDIVAAAKLAEAHEMILRLPNGYDTQIGPGGGLSGGQRQRIGLARALFGEPRLVVLDEPNANLDTEGEMALLQAMRSLKARNITLIVVSHKPSLLVGVDKLLVLRNGMAEHYGPHAEVMAKMMPQSPTAAAARPVLVREQAES